MREKKYSPAAFEKAVDKYFAGISRYVDVTEEYDTGERDADGHRIYAERAVINSLGEKVKRLEYILPPSVGGICEALGISRDTWARYGDSEEFGAIQKRAKEKMQSWNEQELMLRKDVKGIIFNLQNNYGYTEKKDISVAGGVEAYLRSLEGKQEF